MVIVLIVCRNTVSVGASAKFAIDSGALNIAIVSKNAGRHWHGCGNALSSTDGACRGSGGGLQKLEGGDVSAVNDSGVAGIRSGKS